MQNHTFDRFVQIAAFFPWSKLLWEWQHVIGRLLTVNQVSKDSRYALRSRTLQRRKQLKLITHTRNTVSKLVTSCNLAQIITLIQEHQPNQLNIQNNEWDKLYRVSAKSLYEMIKLMTDRALAC